MPLADWFASRPRFRFLEDAFALDRESLKVGLAQAIDLQRRRCDEVWLLAHFFETFVWLQEYLAAADIDYEIVSEPLSIADIQRKPTPATNDRATKATELLPSSESARIRLVLATLIEPPQSRPTRPHSGWPSVAVMACEKHPLATENARLAATMKGSGANVVFGHMLTLDDPLVQPLVTPMVLDVMKQFGLDEQQLVNSRFLSQQLTRKLNRDATTYTSNDSAESSEAWIRINGG